MTSNFIVTGGIKVGNTLTPMEGCGSTPYDRLVRAAEAQLFNRPPGLRLTDVAQAAGVPADLAKRLFPTRSALSIAVIENVMVRMTDHVTRRITAADPQDPVAQFKAMFGGYVEWVMENPVSAAILIERSSAVEECLPQVQKYDAALSSLSHSLLKRAEAAGRIVEGINIEAAAFHGRALSMGLTRMAGSNNRFDRPADGDGVFTQACQATTKQFYAMLFR